ncbi:unnamed protein product [Diatraea saccharalis]|uniref:MYND-type domain-containing protein n=1 Tax=Diatraea saccharalis TaxID=40085 RepID=A0A9N9WCD5_9NEOP|nr:unnamed protein product [Diatraea saccharalis]
MTSQKVDVGFLEEKHSWQLHPRFFPSKVGGKPSWLNLQDLPNSSQLSCKKCSGPLIFLCQVYAPYEDRDDAFHRTIYLFICRNGSCCQSNSNENFVVLRCQLARRNDFYSYEPYVENEDEIFEMSKWPKLCDICGCRAPSHCSKCKKTYYCSKKHQIFDWHKGHKENCSDIQTSTTYKPSSFIVTEAGKSILFKEWELIVDEEDQEENSTVDTAKEMENFRKMIQDKRDGSLNNISEEELEQYAKNIPEDKVFNKFNKRIARHPDQVLRYDRGGKPLWITSNPIINDADIPNCQYCGGTRQFEFQVMPQLLNFINVGIDFNSIDWGILAIFTCKASCNTGIAYKEEHLIKQDLSM